MHWNMTEFALPKLPDGLKWSLLSDTESSNASYKDIERPDKDLLSERSVRIYKSVKDPEYKKKKEVRRKKNGKN